MQEMRKVALQLFTARRTNHFLGDFAERYCREWTDLKRKPNPETNELPLQEKGSNLRLDKKSVYLLAERMDLDEMKYDDELETIRWFANEARAIMRWTSGACFLVAMALFTWLLYQGFKQMTG